MKTAKEVLAQYGRCCIRLQELNDCVYSKEEGDDPVERGRREKDHLRGQMISLEWLFE